MPGTVLGGFSGFDNCRVWDAHANQAYHTPPALPTTGKATAPAYQADKMPPAGGGDARDRSGRRVALAAPRRGGRNQRLVGGPPSRVDRRALGHVATRVCPPSQATPRPTPTPRRPGMARSPQGTRE